MQIGATPPAKRGRTGLVAGIVGTYQTTRQGQEKIPEYGHLFLKYKVFEDSKCYIVLLCT